MGLKKPKIAFVSYGEKNSHPSTYSRSYRISKEMKNIGYSTDFYSGILPENHPDTMPKEIKLLVHRLLLSSKQMWDVRNHDVVYINKKIHPYSFPPILIYCLKYIFRCTIIYDICDPIWEHTPSRVKQALKLADGVVVSGPEIKEYVTQYNDQVFVVPMAVDADKFKPIKQPNNGVPTIGWVGNGPEYKSYLRLLIDPLTQLSEDFEFEFFLTSAQGDEEIYALFEDVPFACDIRDWVPEDELVETMNKIDIGVVPLLDTDWAKGKSPIKILEYKACGIPVVSSKIGDARQMINDGEDGYLVSEEEWYLRLRELLSDEELRTSLGSKGRQNVVNKHSFEATVNNLASIIEQTNN